MTKLKLKNFIVCFLLGLYVFLNLLNSSAIAACFDSTKNINGISYSKNSNIECCCCKKEQTGIKQVFDDNKDGCHCMQSNIPTNKTEKNINAAFSKNIEPEKIVSLYNFAADYLNFPEKDANQKIYKYRFIPNINTDIRSSIVLLI